MRVHFIGAGPGASDLITVRGLRLIQSSPVCLYAGSLVPDDIIREAPSEAHIMNTADMTLDEIITEMKKAYEEGLDVARIHSGDTALYSAVAEQMRHLDNLGIAYDVTPGVPAFCAAAAELMQELTLPGINQSLVLTRTTLNSSPMPEDESLHNLGLSGATMVLHLSVKNIAKVQTDLIPLYGKDCPVIVCARISWPDQQILRTNLEKLAVDIAQAKINRTALIFIGQAMEPSRLSIPFIDSSLYSHMKKG